MEDLFSRESLIVCSFLVVVIIVTIGFLFHTLLGKGILVNFSALVSGID